ncbi:MAG: GyrI-like domain-containing protein [Lachnospiraceae bacterium]|nr:GyrI-like domain-containing protein [Lachnospiraceae bacterium]
MARIIQVYKQALPKTKFVGKRYTEADRENGVFSNKWSEWYQSAWFDILEAESRDLFDDSDAYIGLSRIEEGKPFEYWIGMFLPVHANVPEGFEAMEFEAREVGVCWVKGTEPDIYFHCCLDTLEKNGLEWAADATGVKWCFERYVSPRFTEPDENGEVIVDQCFCL